MGRARATEHIANTTPAIDNERLKALKEILPEAFTEEHLDLEKLQAVLGTHSASGPERYSFSWAGKRDAITALQTPSDATLTPDKKHSIKYDTTRNVFIEGDNLEVLKLLYKPYFGRVKMVYIDPPYNTGNDFVYQDDYKHPIDTYLRLTGQKKEDGSMSTSNPETSGRYHSAWLSMMYPRLFLARQLLTEDGVIFVSIDDNEVHHLRLLMNEIFGEENFLGQIIVVSNRGGRDYGSIARTHEYILAYSRGAHGALDRLENPERTFPYQDAQGPFDVMELRNRNIAFNDKNRPNLFYPFYLNPKKQDQHGFFELAVEPRSGWIEVLPAKSQGVQTVWRWGRPKAAQHLNGDIVGKLATTGRYQVVQKFRDATKRARSVWDDTDVINEKGSTSLKELFGQKVFDYAKPPALMKRLLLLATEEDDIVLDFFAGTCTTAQAALELNREEGTRRRFVMVQLPEPLDSPIKLKDGTALNTIADIGRERIARVIARMKEDKQTKLGKDQAEDLGFRTFRLTASNYKAFDDSPQTTVERFAERLAAVIDPLRPGWKPEPVIYEVALKEGFGLSLNVERVDGKPEVYRVTDPDKNQSFLVCLDDKVSLSSLKSLGLKKGDLFICRDTALDDTTAANLALQCRLKTI